MLFFKSFSNPEKKKNRKNFETKEKLWLFNMTEPDKYMDNKLKMFPAEYIDNA